MLSVHEQAALLAAMRDTVPEDFEPLRRRTETRRVEWRDIPGVVAAAAARHEMAIVARAFGEDRMHFTLRTLDDRPAHLEATRGIDGSIRFAATVGRFEDDTARAASLVATAEAFKAGGVRRVTVAEMLADPPFASGGAPGNE